VLPSADDIRNSAPAFAAAVQDWRVKQAASDRVLILGPTFVGLEGATAQTTAEMSTLFGESVNAQLDSRTRFAQTLASVPDEIADADTVFDARMSWEPVKKSASGQRRLVLELVDPRDGQTVYTTSQSVTPSAAPSPALAEAARGPATLPAGPVAVTPPPRPPADSPSPTPVATAPAPLVPPAPAAKATPAPAPRVTPTPPVAGTSSDGARGKAFARAAPRPAPLTSDHGLATAEAFTARSVPRSEVYLRSARKGGDRGQLGRSPVLRRDRGTIYFAKAALAERVIVVREDVQTLGNGELRLRLIVASQKGNKTLLLRCEFYDRAGAAAGTVADVELRVREGRSSVIAMVSHSPAARYVLFIEED
jgi:hypothetical protein